MQEDKSEEAAKRETKEVQTNELKAERALQKASKKTKAVQCKVILLDGTEYSCDLEVSRGAVLMRGTGAEGGAALTGGVAQCVYCRVPVS